MALLLLTALPFAVTASGFVRWAAVGISLPAAYLLGLTLYLMRRPRLAYAQGCLLVYLRPGKPIRVPIDVVECFFLGQGPTLLPNPLRGADHIEETSTIVIRLAESAEEWKHVDVKPAQGLWCDGYITIRGTWCERIDAALLQRLNQQLVEAHREVSRTDNTLQQEVK